MTQIFMLQDTFNVVYTYHLDKGVLNSITIVGKKGQHIPQFVLH